MSLVSRISLGEVADVITKGTTPTTLKKKFVECGIPFLRINNIVDGEISYKDILYIDNDTNDLLKRSIVKPGDVLLTIAGTIGKTAIIPEDVPLMNCNQAIAIIRLKEELNKKYLKYWLSTPDAITQITGAKVTATISNLSLTQIKGLKIPLPSLKEQERIAEIMDNADAIRRKRQKALLLADDLLRSVFLDMFGDPKTNLKGFRVEKLGSISDFVAGSTLPPTEPFDGQQSGIAVFKVGDMNLQGNDYYLMTPREWANSYAKKHAFAPKGSIVFPKRGGAIGTNKKRILGRDALLDPNLMAVIPNHSVSLVYLRYWFEMLDLASISNGSSVPQLNKKDLNPLKVICAPEDVVDRFERISYKIGELIELHKQALSESNALVASISQKSFLGRL